MVDDSGFVSHLGRWPDFHAPRPAPPLPAGLWRHGFPWITFFFCCAAMHAALANGNGPSRRDESCMLQSVQGDKSCGWDVDCPQRYSIKELQVPAKGQWSWEKKKQHQKSAIWMRKFCRRPHHAHWWMVLPHSQPRHWSARINKPLTKDLLTATRSLCLWRGPRKGHLQAVFERWWVRDRFGGWRWTSRTCPSCTAPKADYRGYDGAGKRWRIHRGICEVCWFDTPHGCGSFRLGDVRGSWGAYPTCIWEGTSFGISTSEPFWTVKVCFWAGPTSGKVERCMWNCHSPEYLHKIFLRALGYEYEQFYHRSASPVLNNLRLVAGKTWCFFPTQAPASRSGGGNPSRLPPTWGGGSGLTRRKLERV